MNLSIVTKEMFGQNEMNIYQNKQNEIFMTREQIGQALEYKNPRRAIADIHNRNKERMDNFSGVSKLRTPQGVQETYIYNEQGIYEIIRRSAQPKADEFYDWVYDLLSKLRKGELQINSVMSVEDMIIAQAQSVKEIKEDVSYLKDNMRIDGTEEFQIRKLANRKVVNSLGGKGAPAYTGLSNKVFARFWRDFKNHFTIPRYGELPKVKFDEGVRFIKAWQPDTSTKFEIEALNRQQVIDIREVR